MKKILILVITVLISASFMYGQDIIKPMTMWFVYPLESTEGIQDNIRSEFFKQFTNSINLTGSNQKGGITYSVANSTIDIRATIESVKKIEKDPIKATMSALVTGIKIAQAQYIVNTTVFPLTK